MGNLLLGTIFLTPIIPAIFDFGFEESKVIFFILAISAAGLIWVMKSWNKLKIEWTDLKLASLFFTGALFLTSVTGMDLKSSFLGKDPYFQGIIFYAYLFLFSLMVSTIRLELKKVTTVLALSSLIVSILAIVQALQLYILNMDIPNYAGRVVSTFGQPNLYAGFLIMSVPFIYFGMQKFNWKRFYLVCLTLSGIAIVISASRISIILLFGFLVFPLFKNLKGKLLLGVAGFFVILSIIFFFQKEILQPKSSEWLFHNAPEKRVIFWPVLLEQYSKRWVQGYGLENIDIAFARYERFHEQRSPAYYGIKNLIVDRAHNYILDLLIFSGIFGTIIWILLVVSLFRKAKGVLLMSLVIYLSWIQLQNQSVVHLMYFWLAAGLIDQES